MTVQTKIPTFEEFKKQNRNNPLFDNEKIFDIFYNIYQKEISFIIANGKHEKKAYYLGGLPGSGKNYLLGQKLNISTKKNKHIIIDADFYKSPLIYHFKKNKIYFTNKQIHLLSALMACNLRNFALQNEYSFYYLSTLANPKNAKIELKKAINAGYKIEVEMIVKNIYECYINTCNRYLNTFSNKENLNVFFAKRFITFYDIKEKDSTLFKSIETINNILKPKNLDELENSENRINSFSKREFIKKIENMLLGKFYIYYNEPNSSTNIMYYNSIKDNFTPNLKNLKEIQNLKENNYMFYDFIEINLRKIMHDFYKKEKELKKYFGYSNNEKIFGYYINDIEQTLDEVIANKSKFNNNFTYKFNFNNQSYSSTKNKKTAYKI